LVTKNTDSPQSGGDFIYFTNFLRGVPDGIPLNPPIPAHEDPFVPCPAPLALVEHRDRKEWFQQIAEWREDVPFSYQKLESGLLKTQQVIHTQASKLLHNLRRVDTAKR